MRRDSSRRCRILTAPPGAGVRAGPLPAKPSAGHAPRCGASVPACLAAAVAAASAAGGIITATAWAEMWCEAWGLDDPDGPPSQSRKAIPAAAEVGVGHHLTPAQASGRRSVPAAPSVGALAAARSPRLRRTAEGVGPPRRVPGGGAGVGGEKAGVGAPAAPAGVR